jgi:Ca2+-binding RTX toxin-like protein
VTPVVEEPVVVAPTSQIIAATTGVDTVSGGEAADTFNAGLSAANMTIGSLDTFDGKGGADILNIALNGTVTPGSIANVETINVTVSATSTMSLTNATGYTALNDTGSTAVGTYSNIEAASVNLTLSDNAVGAEFSYKTAALTGTSDTVNITLSNATGGNTVITELVGAIETVNLTSSTSANSVRFDSDATTLNILGSADLTLGAASTIMDKTTIVNAADASGKVTLTHDNATVGAAVTVTGGSGNDTLTLTGSAVATDTVSGGAGDDTITFTDDLADADTVDGGAGTDTLVGNRADVLALTAAAKITNFEGLTLSDAHSAGTLTTATVQAGIDTVTLAAGSNGGTVTFEAGAKALVMGTASAGALTVNDTGLAVTDSLDITTSKTADSTNGKDMTINGFETVSLSTNTATAKTIDNITVNGDPDADGVVTAATLTLSGAASLTHEAGGVVTLGVAAGEGTIDASAMTGAYVQKAASVGASTIKGGAGADTLYGSAAVATTITGGAGIDTIYGGTAVDTISGEAGNDILHGSGGADTISGGAGNDTFRMDDAQLLATATLNGGEGTDILLVEDLSAVTDAQMTLVSSVETLTSAATGLSATLGAEAMEAGIATVTFAGTGDIGVDDTVTVAAAFTNALTVNLDELNFETIIDATVDGNTFNAGASVSAVKFVASSATMVTDAAVAADLALTGGTSANDEFQTVGGTYIASDLSGITGVETFTISDDASASITIADENATATQSLTLDGRAIINTANTFTVVGTAENDGVIVVHGSAGADAITGTVTATLGDTIYGYGGADIITVAVDAMQTADVIDGGVGSDTLKISGTGTLVDADLTGVTNIEKFEHTGTSTLTTLGTQYMESGSVDITLAAQTNALNLDAITNDQVLNLKAGTDTVDASSMTGALNVKFAEASLTTADTLTGGTGTADTLTITYSGTANISGDFDNVTGFEKIVAATNAAGGLAILDAMTTAASSLELDFTALTSTVATVDMALESNAGITLNTGGGNDVITMSISSVGDTISSGAGDDGITTAIAQLTSADTVDGGAGTDTVTFSDAGAVGDADFTNVSNIEALTLANGTNTIVLGAEYAGTGSVTITGGTGADSITLGAGVTTAQTVALATAGNDTVVATGATGVITVTMDDADLTANDTLTGGSASDVLTITGSGTLNQVTAAEMANVTSFETIKVGSNTGLDLLLNDANTVSGVINVDATLATSGAVTFSGKAENDGTVVYVGGGGVDTVIGTDTTATGDTIGGGAGADVITGGAGGDTITGGAGADLFHYLAVADSTGTAKDSITDFTSGTDFISVVINNSTNTTGQTYDATIQTAAAGTAAVQAGMSGSIGQTFFDTTNNVMVVNANADNLVTTLDYQIGLNAAATAANTVAAGDVRYVITGGSGADTITTGGGNDTITGGLAADIIDAGAGDDTVVAEDTDTSIAGGTGTDVISLAADASFATDTFSGFETFTATADGADLTVDYADFTDFTTVNGFTTSGSAVELIKTTTSTAVTIDLTAITFTGAAASVTTSGAVANTINSGSGGDTMVLGATSAQLINFYTSNGSDTITGFDTTVDHLSFDTMDDITATTGTALAANAAATTVTDGAVYVHADGSDGAGAAAITSYTTLSQVGTFLAAQFSDEAAGDQFVAVINDLAGNLTYAYHVDFDAGNSGAGAIDADAITLLATITEETGAGGVALVTADIM